MITKLKSIEEVITKIVRDLNLTSDFNSDNFVEWIAEALRFIGAYDQFVTDEKLINIDNYKGYLPCNYIHPLAISNYTFEKESDIVIIYPNLIISSESLLHYQNQLFKGLIKNEQLGVFTKLNQTSNTNYRFEHSVIYTSFERGVIRLQFLSMPLNENNYPLVPDDISYDTAFFWYVAKQLSLQGKLNNKELNYTFCNQMWLKYCGQARSSANMPDPMTITRLGQHYNSFIPSIHNNYGSIQ